MIKQGLQFFKKLNWDSAQFAILTPYPGTPLFSRLEKEGRLLHYNWDKYDCMRCVYEPADIKPDKMDWYLSHAFADNYISIKALKAMRSLKRAKEFTFSYSLFMHMLYFVLVHKNLNKFFNLLEKDFRKKLMRIEALKLT